MVGKWFRSASCGHTVKYATERSLKVATERGTKCLPCAKLNRRNNPPAHAELHTQIRGLRAEGISNRESANILGIGRDYINDFLSKEDYSSVRAYRPPKAIDRDRSECNKCGAATLNSEFPYIISKRDGRRLSYCKDCRYKQSRENLKANPKAAWKDKQSRLKNNRRGWDYNLPPDYLLNLWELQNEKCFYTDGPIVISSEVLREAASVDRVDTSLGYVKDNLVLCQKRVNSIKHDQSVTEMRDWMPGWYSRITDAVKDPLYPLELRGNF